jgi:calcium binding protein 39
MLDRSNAAVMMRYVSSKDNLMILMNLLRVSIIHCIYSNLSLQFFYYPCLKYPSSDTFYYCCLQLFSVLFSQDSSKNIQIEAFHVFKVGKTAMTFLNPWKNFLTI